MSNNQFEFMTDREFRQHCDLFVREKLRHIFIELQGCDEGPLSFSQSDLRQFCSEINEPIARLIWQGTVERNPVDEIGGVRRDPEFQKFLELAFEKPPL